MSLFLIALFSFFAILSLVVVIFMVPMAVQDTPQARIKRRLTAIGRMDTASRAEIQNLLKSSVYSEVRWLNELLSRVQFAQRLDLLLERANLDMSLPLFLLCSIVAGFVVLFLMWIVIGQTFPVALIFGIIALFCPYFYVKYITWKRMRLFLGQMPDGLDMISQSLQAGLGLTQAMVFVAKEMADPLGTEFSVFIEEVMSLPEVRLFNTALLVQREVGGSLAELLNKLADIIRDRFRIERLIKSLTDQNRMST